MSNSLLKPISSHPLNKDPIFSKTMSMLPCKYYIDVNRDGNCLYSCMARFIFLNLDNETDRSRFFDLTPSFEKAGISYVVYESYIESINDLISSKRPIETLSDDEWNLFVGYLRLAVAAHLLNNDEEYKQFFPNCDVQNYVRSCVDPMGGRAEQIEIIAISRIFNYEITVFYLNPDGYNPMVFGKGRSVNILYSPDHFEPVYLSDDY